MTRINVKAYVSILEGLILRPVICRSPFSQGKLFLHGPPSNVFRDGMIFLD
jgi:hypothetical protein